MVNFFQFCVGDTKSGFGDHIVRDLGSLMQSSICLAEIEEIQVKSMLLKSTVTAFQKYLCSCFVSPCLEPNLNK